MYTNRAGMKIFTTNIIAGTADAPIAAVAATAAATTTTAQEQQVQQRDYRCGAQVKFNKHNKGNTMLRQAKYNNNTHTDNKHGKRQQQQQQQPQHLHYSNSNNNNNNHNNMHNFARKKYFGNNANNNNNFSCNQQQQPQQQSPFYQHATAAPTSNNNNNNMVMKNQNIIEEINRKHSNSDNNNNNTNKNSNDSNNNNDNTKLPIKSNKNNSSSSTFSTSAESSTSSTFYCSSSELSATSLAINNKSNCSNINDDDRQQYQQPQQQSTPTTLTSSTLSNQSNASAKTQQQNQQQQQQQRPDNGNKAQKQRQQPLCFWKTGCQMQPTPQQQEQQLKEAMVATQKKTELAMAAVAAAAASAGGGGGTLEQQQQQHYYQYYYSHPKQLTIASFLQKEQLPETKKVSPQQQNEQQQQQQQQHKQQYQQRYRNYGYNGNNYQQQQQQQQHTHPHQAQHQHNQNNNHMHNSHFRRNKKVNFNGTNNTATTSVQKPIEILPTNNYNGAHRRMQNGSIAANNHHVAGNKSGYNQSHQHRYHTLMPGTGITPNRSEHQKLYNLTYVNVGMQQSLPPPSQPPPSTGATTATVPTPTPTPTIGIEDAATASVATNSATTTNRCLYLQPPPPLRLAMLGPSVSSPVTPTPESAVTTLTNMISCAQLDEAITAAAASGTSNHTATNKHVMEPAPVLCVHSPSYATLPFMLHQQPQRLYPNKSQQQPFFGSHGDMYKNAAWSHGQNSPCYTPGYGPGPASISSGSTHSRIPSRCAVSPASSTCSLASESQWSNRSRFASTEILSVSPTPSVAGATPVRIVPSISQELGINQQAATSPHLGNMVNNVHPMLSFAVPPPRQQSQTPNALVNNQYPHYCGPNCGCNGNGMPYTGSWFEMILPPDRYQDHARNIEITTQPEQLICNSKYDNLSSEIWKYFRGAQQTQATFKIKMRLWRYMFLWLNQPVFTGYRICLVGSTITGFGTDSSDIDMCLLPDPQTPQHLLQQQQQQHDHHHEQRSNAISILNTFYDILRDAANAFHDFNLIEARVPILRFKDRLNGIEVDLNYNNCVGIKNTYLLQFYAQLDWRTRPLVVLVKLWAQYHDINDAKRMTVSSYSLVLMVLHYLQYGCSPCVLPCLQALYPEKFNLRQQDCLDLDLIEPIEPLQSQNKQTLGEHLIGFFNYYSTFDFQNYAISVRTGGILPVNVCRLAKSPKNDIHQWKELNIEEPFDLSNTARSVYDRATFERVKTTFVVTARRLEHTLDLVSVFTQIHHTPQRLPMHHGAAHHHVHSYSPSHGHAGHYLAHQPHHQSYQHLLHPRGANFTAVPSARVVTTSTATTGTTHTSPKPSHIP